MTLEQDLIALRATYPDRLSPLHAVTLLNAFAWQHRAIGFGLYRAPDGGNGWPLPNGVRVRCDILAVNDAEVKTIYDVFRDGPDSTKDPVYHGEATVVWQDKGPLDVSRWVPPLAPESGTVVPNPGTPAAVDFSAIMAKLIDLDDAYRGVRVEQTLMRELLADIRKRQDRKYRSKLTLPFVGERSLEFAPEG